MFLTNAFLSLRYLIDSYWYKQLRKYLGLSQNGYDTTQEPSSVQAAADTPSADPTHHPGPVDNTRLFKEITSDHTSNDEEIIYLMKS